MGEENRAKYMRFKAIKEIGTIHWRLEFQNPVELLLNIQLLFRSPLINRQLTNNDLGQDLEKPTNMAIVFWLASAHLTSTEAFSVKDRVKANRTRSVCLELGPIIGKDLDQKVHQKMANELRKLGWIRFRVRKDEALNPLYSWQQFLPPKQAFLDDQPLGIEPRLDPKQITIQCKYIGTQEQCSSALTQALKIAQSRLIESTKAFQIQTLMPATYFSSQSSSVDLIEGVFSFVFIDVDHYFLNWLESQSQFWIDLVFPSTYDSNIDLDHLTQTRGDLFQNVWSESNVRALSKSQLKRDEDQVINKANLLTKEMLRWSAIDSSLLLQNLLDSYFKELDAILIKTCFIDDFREFISTLKPLYTEVYSLAFIQVNNQNYCLINLIKRPYLSQKRDRQQNHSDHWAEEHLQRFKEFVYEIRAQDVDQPYFFTCISQHPLFYLALESDLQPKLNRYEQLRILQSNRRAQSATELEGELNILSPFLSHEKTTQNVELFQIAKPKFYRHEEFPLMLYPQRLNRIRQWFDESFICLSPQAFDDET